ncbi:hypothetical protein [Streptomyces sp. NBC_01483]|uniref:hypothetical protein n=1 Tax=Streptomyces sp. NBC_01483 TaxID=2903883 RepID=UPI002E3712C5|nr:hypothetical protein [Streptomyces sp. NBC_01483]
MKLVEGRKLIPTLVLRTEHTNRSACPFRLEYLVNGPVLPASYLIGHHIGDLRHQGRGQHLSPAS